MSVTVRSILAQDIPASSRAIISSTSWHAGPRVTITAADESLLYWGRQQLQVLLKQATRLGKPSCRQQQDLRNHMTHHYKSARTGEAHLWFQQCVLQALLAPKCSASCREGPSEFRKGLRVPSVKRVCGTAIASL